MMGLPITVVLKFLEEEEAPRQKKPRRNEQPPFAKNAVYVVDSTT